MQSVWKPAEGLHFHADSMPVLPYVRLCILSLSLYVMSLTAPRPNPKCYDRGQAGLNAAHKRLNIILFCSFLTVEQKQFNMVASLEHKAEATSLF